MKYILFIIYAGLTLINLLKFQQIEQSLLKSGVSWTFSKIFPYVSLLILGFLMGWWLSRRLMFRVKYVRAIVFWAVFIIPFVIGFILHPIYEGDFAQQAVELTDSPKLKEFKNTDLVVITIPDCPYCFGAIAKLKLIKERNPDMRISFVVCSSDKNTLKPYKEEAGNAIKVSNAKNIETLSQIAEMRFPSFVFVKNNQPVCRWTNDQFGVRAIDKLEKEFMRRIPSFCQQTIEFT